MFPGGTAKGVFILLRFPIEYPMNYRNAGVFQRRAFG
jgi:hypothetical protein